MLRFRRDDGNEYPKWKQMIFGDLADYKKGPFGSALKKEIFVPKSDSTIKVYEQQNAIEKNYKLERYFITEDYYKKMQSFEVKGGDIIVSCAGTIGEMYILPPEAEKGVINQALMRVREKKEVINKNYFVIVFSNMLLTEAKKLSNGSALKNIPPFSDLKKQKTNIPCLEEQQKIVDFLSEVDNIIDASEQEIESLEMQKKGAMQKIFSQEVRFKADDGSEYPEWEECQFKNMFKLLQTNTYSRSQLNESCGEVFNIHYGDVLVRYGSVINANEDILPFINEDIELSKFKKESYIQDGDIIIADTAEDYSAGKVSEVKNVGKKKILSGLHTMLCRPQKKFASMYLGYYMNCNEYHSQIVRLLVGTKVYSINKSVILQTTLKIPCLEEQQKIADFLSEFDITIEYTKEELEVWKNIKKGLLQQMFE